VPIAIGINSRSFAPRLGRDKTIALRALYESRLLLLLLLLGPLGLNTRPVGPLTASCDCELHCMQRDEMTGSDGALVRNNSRYIHDVA